eukprot:jgi/Mesen1/7274/ME000373S06339
MSVVCFHALELAAGSSGPFKFSPDANGNCKTSRINRITCFTEPVRTGTAPVSTGHTRKLTASLRQTTGNFGKSDVTRKESRVVTVRADEAEGGGGWASNFFGGSGQSMARPYEVAMMVRDYEIDMYGVVNNAVYAHYCQHARHMLLEEMGVPPYAVAKAGDSLALSDMTLKFLGALRSGDEFVTTARISEVSAARIYIEHSIFRLPDRQPILEGKVTVVCLDRNYRPVRIPVELKSKMTLYLRRNS